MYRIAPVKNITSKRPMMLMAILHITPRLNLPPFSTAQYQISFNKGSPYLCRMVKMPQVARSLNVLVVGGGLGGFATALALQTDGHSVRVIDAVPEFAEVSIQILLPDSKP